MLHSLSSAICVKFDSSLLELKNSSTVLVVVLQLLPAATNGVGTHDMLTYKQARCSKYK